MNKMTEDIIIKETKRQSKYEEKKRELHDKYRSQYRFECKCCKFRSHYINVIMTHTQSRKHNLTRDLNRQEYDYIKYEKAIPLGEEPEEEGQKIKLEIKE